MFMKEVFSKSEDCVWLAHQLKNQMGDYVSFNEFGIDSPILTGVYDKKGIGGPYYNSESVRFYIKFCKGEFLRVQIEIGCSSNENVANAMNELIKALASIKQEEALIGLPIAIFEVSGSLTSEYAFKNPEIVIESLKNNTMFDDENIKDLRFLKTCNKGICWSDAFGVGPSKDGSDIQIQENETDINTGFEEGVRPYIKALCKNICDNKK